MSKGRIPIKEAERISDQYRCPTIIIWAIHDDGNHFTVTTYGQTKKLCRHAADMGAKLTRAIELGLVAPEEIEPTELPDYPEYWKGNADEQR